jgi:cell division protein FtsZ
LADISTNQQRPTTNDIQLSLNLQDMMFDINKDEASIIKVIGVGGGGSNAVTHMYKQGIVGVDFAICNTDAQAMEQSTIPVKIQLGPEVSAGLGAGSQPQKGKQACIESIDEVKKYLLDTRMLFITAGMGGGTGTGAAPIIAKAAQEMGILTVGIVTLPFTFEGKKRTNQGFEGLAELKKNVDTLIVISNDKLRQIYGNLTLTGAFAQADNILTTAAKGIAEIITVPGYVNVDFEDVNTVMRGSGVAIMGIGTADGDNRAKKAVDFALSSPLLEDSNIQGAQHILVNITSGTKEVTMDEIFEITEFVQEEAGYGTNLIWGNCHDDTLGDKLSVTVIATGYESKTTGNLGLGQQQNDGKVMVSLDDTPRRTETPKKSSFFDLGFDDSDAGSIELESNRFSKPTATPQQSPKSNYNYQDPYQKNEDKEKVEEEKRKRLAQDNMRRERLRSNINNMKLNNPQTIVEMENEPAYLRRGVKLENVLHSSDKNMSQWTIEDDDIRTNNSFLHDNVD